MSLFLKVAKYKNGKTYLSIVDGYPEFCSWVNLKTTSTPVMAKKNFVNFFAFLCCVIVCNVV